jgi:hypothetical protein
MKELGWKPQRWRAGGAVKVRGFVKEESHGG